MKVRKPLGDKYVVKPVTLGDRIRNRRLELGLLQKDVANMIGVSEDTITFWEKNRVDPSERHVSKIWLFLSSD